MVLKKKIELDHLAVRELDLFPVEVKAKFNHLICFPKENTKNT
jgi:hypothetical protein